MKKCRFIIIVALICIAIGGGTLQIHAGDINGAEAGVIAVASGTFTYDGKTYKAYSDYVNTLYSYLSSDDVDLTTAQASKAISYIYSNVKSGIDSGYIYEVSEPEENNTDLDGWTPNLDDYGVELDTSEDEDASQKTAKKASDREVEQLFQNLNEDYSYKSKSSPKASESDASMVLTDDELIITTDDGNIEVSSTGRIVPKSISSGMVIISLVILVIDILIFLILTFKGCMRFRSKDRDKHRKGHRVRRRIRRVCRDFLTVTSTVAISMIFIMTSLSIGLFNNNKIIQNIQSSGYFRYSYLEYVADADQDSFLNYEEFMLEEKKALTNLESSELTDGRSIAPYIRQLQSDMRRSLIFSFAFLLAALCIAFVSCIFMDLRRDRGIRSIAISELIGTVLTLITAIIIKLIHIDQKVMIEPKFLYNFVNSHLDWVLKVTIIVAFFGAVVGMSLVGLYKSKIKSKD